MLLVMPTSTYSTQSMLVSVSGILSSHCSSTLSHKVVHPFCTWWDDAEREECVPSLLPVIASNWSANAPKSNSVSQLFQESLIVPTEHDRLCEVAHSHNPSTQGGNQEDQVFKINPFSTVRTRLTGPQETPYLKNTEHKNKWKMECVGAGNGMKYSFSWTAWTQEVFWNIKQKKWPKMSGAKAKKKKKEKKMQNPLFSVEMLNIL